ncbi:hypothetical protein PORUE0001_0677 [Porphyromonas uenonis 60-3]|uniref:Uncharacterized protein n=1 Tax=Porphyromonas uenonis 60-3 TaxID=596327 RepID=C2MBJ6_9PORP|nr:hypothetical protein PORUE0001_0677 [Porphyromonas uenonis 60-3]
MFVLLYYNGRSTERPYNRYSYSCTTTDALSLNTITFESVI